MGIPQMLSRAYISQIRLNKAIIQLKPNVQFFLQHVCNFLKNICIRLNEVWEDIKCIPRYTKVKS